MSGAKPAAEICRVGFREVRKGLIGTTLRDGDLGRMADYGWRKYFPFGWKHNLLTQALVTNKVRGQPRFP